MEKLKYSKIGIVSFLLALIPIIYVFIQTLFDIFIPINVRFNKGLDNSYFIMNSVIMSFMLVISLISFLLGIVAITQKGYKKGLPISSIIISGLILLLATISFIEV